LAASEIAFNEADNTLYYGRGNNGANQAQTIIPIAGPGSFLPLSGGQLSNGLGFGAATAASNVDLTRHVNLFDGGGANRFGFNVSYDGVNAHLNYVVTETSHSYHTFVVGAANITTIGPAGLAMVGATDITLTRDPQTALHAVWRQYLDNNYSNNTQGDVRWVNVGGDEMTGQLVVSNTLFANGNFLFNFRNSGNPWPVGGYGALGWNVNGAWGEVDFVNACSWAPAGFDWLQVTGDGTWKSLMSIRNDAILRLYGTGIGYNGLPSGGNAVGYTWDGGWVTAYVDGSLIGKLTTSDFISSNYAPIVSGGYLALSGGYMTGVINFNNSGNNNYIGQGNDGVGAVNNNIKISSWWGVGFYNNVGAGSVPAGQAGIYFDCRNGVGYFTGLNVTGDAVTHNIYHDGSVGIMYRGVGGANWYGFKYDNADGTHVIIDATDHGALAFRSWVSANYAPITSGSYVAKGGDVMTGRLTINAATPPWGAFNFGSQLVITGPQNNSIAIFDNSNANGIGITNAAGTLVIAGMPALTDSATAPVDRFRLTASLATFSTPVQINYTPTDTTAQLWLRPTGGFLGKSIIRFGGTFAPETGDGGPRYVASIRAGFASNAWGYENLDIWLSNTANDANSDAGQARAVRFTLGQTTIDTPVTINRNLAVLATSGNDPMYIRVPNGQWARYFSEVQGTRTWAAGTRNDGVYVISDENAPAIRFHIDLSGNAAFYQGLSVTNSLNVTGGINLVNAASTNPQDMSRGITFWGAPTSGYGLVVTDSTMNYNVFLSNNKHDFYAAGNLLFRIQGGDWVTSNLPMRTTSSMEVQGNADVWGYFRAGGNHTAALAAAANNWGGLITNNITQGQGETDFVNFWYPYGGFRWYQKDTAGATTLRTLMQLQPNGNLGLGGAGIYYTVATGGNAIGFGFASDGTANRVKLYVDNTDQGFLATTAFTDGAYLKLTGGSVTGHTDFSPDVNFINGSSVLNINASFAGGWNGIVTTGDATIFERRDAPDTGALTLMTWSSSPLGIRIDGAAHTIRMDAVSGVNVNAPVKIVKAGDGFPLIVSGNTRGVRFLVDATQMNIEGVDQTGITTYQPLGLGGSRINLNAVVYGLNAGDRATFQTGIYMNNNVASGPTDLSHGIDMYGGGYGFSITGGTLNIVAGGATNFYPNGAFVSWINNAGMGFVTGKVLTLGRDPIDPMEAVTRQFFDYRQLYYNVKHYGAVDRVETGNATNDNATAVQNTDAINSTVTAVRNAGGGTVFFPAGTYLTSGTIALYPGVSVMGVGTASIIKPRTSMWTFAYLFGADTDVSASVSNLKIAPAAGMCVGVIGQFANLLKIHDVTFEGTNSYSIYLDRCGNYVIEDCFVTSSLSFPGGSVTCWDSTGGNHGGGGTITRVRFVPMSGAPHGDSPFGHNGACIYLDGQATTNITECFLMWGAYGAGPITFILLQGNCQGNILRDNLCLGVYFGILIQPGGPSGMMPSYISMIDNTIDSYGGIGIFIAASTTQSGRDMVIRGGAITQPGRLCTSVSLGNQGSGYWVGDLLTGPNPPFEEEGSAVIIQVTTIGGSGNVTGTSIYNQGLCQTFPTTVPVAYTGGHGSGATFYPNYSDAGVGVWMRNTNRFNISDVYMETYAGHQLGYGFFLQNSTNGNMSRNQVYDHYDAIWMYDNNVYNIIFSQNILVGNAHVDFGGSVPQYSVVQDNIGVPWLSGTPALPATGAFAVNTMPYSQQVFITGGVMFGIAIRFGAPPGIGIQPAVGGQWNEPIILTLRPGNSIAVSYTTAPTWTWIPML
jgi:hypothetical protein